MEIGNLSSLYIEDARFAAPAMGIGKSGPESGLRRPGLSGGSGVPFTEYLERLDGKVSRDGESAAPPASAPHTQPPNPDNPASASLNLRSGSSLLAPPLVDKTSRLYEQCEALETFLVKTLLTGMRNTVQKSGFIDEGFAGKMYEDMLYDEYAKDFTRNAGFGLAELAYLELTGQRGKVIIKNP
jgi:flagellar protein FlgJ